MTKPFVAAGAMMLVEEAKIQLTDQSRNSSPPSKDTGLTASAGISYNKFLAKLASDHRKPKGQFAVTPAMGEMGDQLRSWCQSHCAH
jgi:CubicO group peptidase (beta-lactamase class C family)